MTPDYEASVRFLENWESDGPWTLVAITTDKQKISGRTLKSTDEVREFLRSYGDHRNIYFSVNPLMRAMNSKPARTDVKSLSWLHVDIDPRAGEPFVQEQERALALLQNPPEGIPAPTAIVFSGGGYQGFWKLTEPKDIDGVEAAYEDAKRYNQQLELAFGADNCHNVDRIMRLPGTINRPDLRKMKKGRVDVLAELVSWEDSNVYPLQRFAPAPPVQVEKTGFGPTENIDVSGNVARLDSVESLPDSVSDKCKVVIVQGDDPDNPYPSRSEALFFVCCELVRAEVDDQTIYAVLTDPGFGISSSVIDKGSNAERYAVRQIERAHEDAIDPHLREMNEKYACVPFGGKMRVIYEDHDEILGRHRLVKMTFDDFRNMHMNRKVQMGTDANNNPRFVALGRWWLEQEHRRQYSKVTFAPGRETPGSYNMWRGFAFEPIKGNSHENYLSHLRENICGGSEEVYQYIVRWMANAVQKPDQPGQTAIVLRGDQGVGKGFFSKMFGKLFGRHYLLVANAQHLTGNFNAHLRDCVVLFADEAFYANDKKHASVLKTLVTEDTIMVEPKGVDSEMAANCLHLIMASNEDWVVPAGLKERRFCVVDVLENRIQDATYFGTIAKEMERGGFATLLHFLLNLDLSEFNVRKLPVTAALRQQKIHSFEPMEEWWYQKLRDGKILVDDQGWEASVSTEMLKMDFVEYTKQFNISRRGSATMLGHFIRRIMPDNNVRRYQTAEQISVGDRHIPRPYFYEVPSLENCRDWFDKKFGGPHDWPKDAEVEQSEESF